jgi:hypothetical protein
MRHDALLEMEGTSEGEFLSKQAAARTYKRILDELMLINREANNDGTEHAEPKSIDDYEREQFLDAAGESGPNFGTGY